MGRPLTRGGLLAARRRSVTADAASVDPTIRRIPAPEEPVPALAWPTVGVFAAAVAIWCTSGALAIAGIWPWPLSVLFNTAAAFALFTVVHEACHRTLSTNAAVNAWLGRIAMLFFGPYAGFGMFRFIHMQHHRFTNHHDGSDPDHYASTGRGWRLLLRWLTLDLNYVRFYAARRATRPRAEVAEALAVPVLVGSAQLALVFAGQGFWVLVLWLLPSRLSGLLLSWSFDYLPHHGLHHTPSEDRLKTTRNRVGAERLLTPLLLYQNYHLVHHLHPIIPFYRYIAVWRRNEETYLTGHPALSTPRGRPLTADEYRRLRELAHQH
jgi:fatty acid desaturase